MGGASSSGPYFRNRAERRAHGLYRGFLRPRILKSKGS